MTINWKRKELVFPGIEKKSNNEIRYPTQRLYWKWVPSLI